MKKKIKDFVDEKISKPTPRIYSIAGYSLEYPITEEGYLEFIEHLLDNKPIGALIFLKIDKDEIIEKATHNLASNLEKINENIREVQEEDGDDLDLLMVEAKLLIAKNIDDLIELTVLQEGYSSFARQYKGNEA